MKLPFPSSAAVFLIVILTAEPHGFATSHAPPGIQPGSTVVRYASTHRIKLQGFEVGEKGWPAQPGDQLTIQDLEKTRQWLVEVQSVALTEREAKSKPGTGLGILSMFQSSLKTDTGHEFSFEQVPVALEVRTHGPFSDDIKDIAERALTTARVLATRDYLAHGLAPMAEIELRLQAAGKKNPGLSLMFRPKYSEEQIAATKARALDAGFTGQDERVYAEAIYAIVQFGNLAFKTDGMDVITREIADSPTLFSGAFTNLVWPEMEFESGEAWGLADARIFRVPYNFLSKTKASGIFYFTAVRPPLQNVAGFVGLTVNSTSKAPGKRLIMRVLAGRLGSGK